MEFKTDVYKCGINNVFFTNLQNTNCIPFSTEFSHSYNQRQLHYFFLFFLLFYRTIIFANRTIIHTNRTIIFTNWTQKLCSCSYKGPVKKIMKKNPWKIISPVPPHNEKYDENGSKHEVIYWNSHWLKNKQKKEEII